MSFSDFESSDAAIANMSGQYLMNKQVSVQYAYKKDGKGERHGDQAERMLAAQARKHNVQPPTPSIPPQFSGPGTPMAPAVATGDNARPLSTGPTDLGMGRGVASPGVGYQNVPPPQPNRPMPVPTPLANPPPGLPARPPPSQAGYGGPQTFMPPGFNNTPNQQAPFPPQAAPPPGFAPPGLGPSGTPVAPPPLPPGFQQGGYGRGR